MNDNFQNENNAGSGDIDVNNQNKQNTNDDWNDGTKMNKDDFNNDSAQMSDHNRNSNYVENSDGSYHFKGSDLDNSSFRSSSYQSENSNRNSDDDQGGNSNRQGSNYNSYEFSTPIDPAPVDDTIYKNNSGNASPKSGKKSRKEKRSGTGRKFGLCLAFAATFGLVAGGVFLGVAAAGINVLGLNEKPETVYEIPKVDTPNVSPGTEAEADAVASKEGNLTVSQVAESCMPAMVAITNKTIQEIPNFFGYGSQAYESESSGSGIIIDQSEAELLIATNNHVISGADSLTVAFVDGELVEAIVKGTDPQNDLAVVSVKLSDIKPETLQQIKVIQIGDSDELQVGDQVVAIGNALGFGQSVSSGWVSALNREVTIDNTTHTLLQTDAAINPGNSGGALLNMRGELIGINEAKYSSSYVEGMGYAIPVSTATPILSELMSLETRYQVDSEQASYMGVVCRELSEEFTQVYGVPAGAFIDSVEEGGPAEAAGIQRGDIVVKLDTRNISSYTDLVDALKYYAAGETIDVTVCRADDGEYVEKVLTITLGEKPEE